MKDHLDIIIGGEAGQGLVTIGQILTKSLVRAGYHITVNQGYHSRIRGGHNTYMISIDTKTYNAPPPEPHSKSFDISVALDEITNQQASANLKETGLLVTDDRFSDQHFQNTLKIPYKALATGRYENIAALGVITSLLGLEENTIAKIVNESFGKHPEAIEANKNALTKSFEWIDNQITASRDIDLNTYKLSATEISEDRLLMHGNEAIALGAISAGLKFCSFYPMTPATSIALTLAAHSTKMGIVTEQAEDEISAINMAIGASYAGAPAMVTTSGGGFALMTEGVSLAAMIETPIVIAIAQRPGPATGMPTRTEQADLEFALYSGHGEFARAIYAPSSIEECFYITREAFRIAEKYQGPVFILTDQFFSDSYRSIKPFETDDLEAIKPGTDPAEIEKPYLRYKLTSDGISPRLIPGISEHLVIADSDEHTEDGHLTEDEVDHVSYTMNSDGEKEYLSIRRKMAEKRLKKSDVLKKEAIAPIYVGDTSPDILMVSWGSTKGAVEEAVNQIKTSGKSAAMLHFSQVWPLVPDTFMNYLESAKTVVLVESSATGQFARLIRGETSFEIKEKILRYDGLPMTQRYILEELKQVIK